MLHPSEHRCGQSIGDTIWASLHVSAAAKENKVTFPTACHVKQYKEYGKSYSKVTTKVNIDSLMQS